MKKCEFCGKMVEDEDIIEFNVVCGDDPTPISTSHICKECYKPLENLSEEEFSKSFSRFLEGLTDDWEIGTKENSKEGTILKILSLKGEEDHVYYGKTGVITHIDDIGQLHGTWGGLAVIPEKDSYLILKGDK